MRALLLLVLAALPLGAAAEYAGPALDACRAHGERELRKDGADVKALAFDNDRHLYFERESRKLGSQPIGASLSGHGAIVRASGPAVEMAFLCLLENEQRALWFDWLPRRDAPALAQCRRGPGAGDCLQTLLNLAERDLTEASSIRFQQALEADRKAGNESASDAYRDAASAWRKYRDLECARRGAGGGEEWRA
ncbi:MAG: lysozyme inhibitor LprI family protein, partial [Burkholderiales bacterium]